MTAFGGQETNYFSPNGTNAVNEDKLRPLFTQQNGMTSHLHQDTFSNYLPRSMASDALDHPRTQFPLSFSPFSPDTNTLVLVNQRKTSEECAAQDALSHSEHFRRFDSTAADSTALRDRSLEPLASIGASCGPQKFGAYLDRLSSSRSPSREKATSRPNSHTSSQGRSAQTDLQEVYDPIQDLNGTLASLDLDNNSSWKASGDGAGRKAHGL